MSSFIDSSLNHYPEFHREVIRTVIYRLEKDLRMNHEEQINQFLYVSASNDDDSIIVTNPNQSQNTEIVAKKLGQSAPKQIKRSKRVDNLATFEESFATNVGEQ